MPPLLPSTLASHGYREIHFLLGDWLDPTVRTVARWRGRFDEGDDGPSLSGIYAVDLQVHTARALEQACADLYDARVKRANAQFLDLLLNAKQREQAYHETLARLGSAHAWALLKRHERAQNIFQRTQAEDPVVGLTLSLLASVNASNWGSGGAAPGALPAVPDGLPRPLAALLTAFHAYAFSRLCLRAGARREGLDALLAVTGQPTFAQLAPIVRGHVLRMTGILLDVSGRRGKGRELLEQAFAVYQAAGYDHGVVQAAISLTRVTESVDPERTRWYLGRAEELVEPTDAPGQERPEGRQMLGERAALLSRRAHLAFVAGHIEDAIRLCREDLAQVLQLAKSLPGGLPREEAIVHRHLGRMLLAREDHAEAEACFARSAALFARVHDDMNVFFSRARRFASLVALGRLDDAQGEVAALEAILAGREQEVREKEEAIVETLRATLYWRKDRDAENAQALLARAVDTLHRYGRDYYYGVALLLDAEIYEDTGDPISAHHRLHEARACAVACEAEDLRRTVDERLARMPIEPGHTQIRQRLGRLELSVLYADLRNFGRASASLEPAKMSEFIKGFAERVSRGTRRHGGHPTRFLGDSAMMLFGLSAAGAITKERLAAQAACEIYELFRYLRSQWDHTPEVSSMGLTFAIATGEVTIGQFGWEGLSAFTAIGDRVNLAGLLARNCRDGELSCCDVTFQRLRRQHPSLRGEERTEVLGELGSRTSYRCRVALLVDDLAIQAAPRTRAVPAP